MPPSSPTNRKLSNPSPTRNQLVERCSTLRGYEFHDCVYSVVSDHPRSVFSTNTARRLSSGSACETCRRRKTKCDGNSPCSFCASNGIDCVNNSERRKRSVVASSLSSPSNLPITPSSLATSSDNTALNSTTSSTTTSSSSATTATTNAGGAGDNEAIDRIEDRLRRIEKLMTAFTPSPLSQSPLTKEIKELKHAASGFRKMSSPHLQHASTRSPTHARQQRHSIHSMSSPSSSASTLKKEHSEFHRNNNLPYVSPPNSNNSSKTSSSAATNHNSVSSPSPPLSPRILKQSSSQHSTNVVASSMLNLSLSPSSSSTSSSSYMQPSISTPTSPLAHHSVSDQQQPHAWNQHHNTASSSLQKEWKQSSPIPSLMDQLSKCTFVTTAMDYTTVHYPIYPITPPTNSKTMGSP
ncbi:Peptide methionine sulfoxide reductase B2, chloroplastic [Mucor velutinosus]|uniref:Peptide methionine sulfoxide reductase B2, chloroplastic n=1 Tax=Mucor velutinosus TaxID=708070 RepID=A0AAN7DI48_9FUNG|nr:Peptide methionine sulfoxide reductase B2, chloroplastic [Mucor velutinosus]